jgi:hypothetical protein
VRRIPYGRNRNFLDRSRYILFHVAPQIYEAEWTSFQTHYFLKNLVAQEIEPGPLDLLPGTLATRPQRRSGTAHVDIKIILFSCHHNMARPQVADGGDDLPLWRVAPNVSKNNFLTADMGCPPA